MMALLDAGLYLNPYREKKKTKKSGSSPLF